METYGETLNYFKKTSTPEKVVALMGNDKLIDALLAWKSTVITYKNGLAIECPFKEENERWYWLWENISFDMKSFGIVADLKVQEVNLFFERLRGLKLIYPDGTIDLFASQYLNTIIVKAIGKKK